MAAVELPVFSHGPWARGFKYESIPDDGGSLEEVKADEWHIRWQRMRAWVLAGSVVVSLLFLVLVSSSLLMGRDALLSVGMTVSDVPFDVVEHPEAPTKFWGDRTGPLPTGAFWTNFVVENGDAPANLLPYGIKCVEDGIQASYNPTRRVVNELVISDPFDNDLQITAEETYIDRAVSDYDSLSVAMKYEVANQGSYTAHLVKGAAFVTVSFDQATPIVKAPNMQIINAELRDSSGKKVADMEDGIDHRRLIDGHSHSHDFSKGVQYLLDLGNFQKWLVYVSDPRASLVWDKAGNKMTASGGPSNAFVRIAVLPPRKDPESVDAACGYLLKYVHNYPVGASVDLDYDKTGKFGVMSYHFATEGLAGKVRPSSDSGSGGGGGAGGWWASLSGLFSGGQPTSPPVQSPDSDSPSEAAANANILMYALPHHVKALDLDGGGAADMLSAKGEKALPSMYCLKGPLTPVVVGSTWTMRYRLADEGWDYYVRSDVPSWQLDVIADQLIEDVSSTPTEALAADSYNFGKEIGRMARLVGIADYLGIIDQRDDALEKLRAWLRPWLEGTNDDHFVYDSSYGGVVTSKGLADKMADFGLGYYNDHHFHYGYFVYAFSMVSRFDRDFLRRYQPAMDSIAHDICSHHGAPRPASASSSSPASYAASYYSGSSSGASAFPCSAGESFSRTARYISLFLIWLTEVTVVPSCSMFL